MTPYELMRDASNRYSDTTCVKNSGTIEREIQSFFVLVEFPIQPIRAVRIGDPGHGIIERRCAYPKHIGLHADALTLATTLQQSCKGH